jgi:hypothetical protein
MKLWLYFVIESGFKHHKPNLTCNARELMITLHFPWKNEFLLIFYPGHLRVLYKPGVVE